MMETSYPPKLRPTELRLWYKAYCLLVKPLFLVGKICWGKTYFRHVSSCQHVNHFPAYVYLLPPALPSHAPQKTSCRSACGITLALRERSLGPQPGGNAPAPSGCVLFEIQKPIGFGQVPCRVYRVYLTRKGMSTPRLWKWHWKNTAIWVNHSYHEIKNNGTSRPYLTVSLPSCITASQLLPKFKNLGCWYLSQPSGAVTTWILRRHRNSAQSGGPTLETAFRVGARHIAARWMENAICGPSKSNALLVLLPA